MPEKIQEILKALKKNLIEIYGERLKDVYLFGSYARGEENFQDSDIDILILLDGKFNYWEESKRTSQLTAFFSSI